MKVKKSYSKVTEAEKNDELNPSKGILFGITFGTLIWLIIIVVIYRILK